MVRTILAVIVGYLVTAIAVFALLLAAWFGLGAQNVFRGGSWDISTVMAVLVLLAGIIAALVGGWVAGKIDPTGRGPLVLAVLFLLIGLVMGAQAQLREAPPPRSGPVTMEGAGEHKRDPAWLVWLNPVTGALGVLLGGAATRSKPKRHTAGA